MTFALLFAIAGLVFAGLLAAGSGDDDSQVLRLQESSGTFAIAVFAPAGDLGAGRSQFNVLVQDRNTREVLLDTTVDVTAHASGEPQPTAATARASHEDSENKLMQTAELDFPPPGTGFLILLSDKVPPLRISRCLFVSQDPDRGRISLGISFSACDRAATAFGVCSPALAAYASSDPAIGGGVSRQHPYNAISPEVRSEAKSGSSRSTCIVRRSEQRPACSLSCTRPRCFLVCIVMADARTLSALDA